MRWIILALAGFIAAPLGALAESPVPERRIVVTPDVDFYGSDLQALFDTTYDACINACLSNPDCRAFTFNTRSTACFPKSSVSERQPYDGALSAEIHTAPPHVRALAETRQDELAFLTSDDISGATRLAADIGRIHTAGQWEVPEMLEAARTRRANGDLAGAMRWMGGAVAKSDASDQWAEYARLNRDIETDNHSDRNTNRNRALHAAINAYLRAPSAPGQVSALMIMAEMLEQTGRGRDMIPALRLAERLQPRADVTAALDDAISKYGFRIIEHRVDNDTAQPRICAEFSEPLIKAGTDYTPFVRLPDQRLAVQAEDRQICIDGVEHGSRYTVTFREGLPAASGEALIKDVTLTLYVRDRAPEVRFPGRAYILPRTTDAGLPVETVNLDTVELTLYRVSDRNLLRTILDNDFARPLPDYRERDFSENVAETVWTGEAETRNTLNADMTTRLPVGDVIADLPAGLYALSAAIPGVEPYEQTGATQWFVLSDLGVTTLSGTDGLHVFVRGLRDAAPREGTKVTLLNRANRVLGEAVTDADGHARFAAGLTRGTGSKAPALVTLEEAEDFAFLSLTDPAFDLSDRGVEGRAPAPPVDLFLATDRGAYRAGETIHATALARGDMAQALPGLPVTAILTRPDGVEYTRKTSTDDVAGGHVFSFPLGATVPRGAWTLAIKSDLDADPLATARVLVEDFLPERIDFDLTLPEGPLNPLGTPELRIEARYLFGAPGADLPVTGHVTLRPRDTVEGFSKYRFGRHDNPVSPRTNSFDGGRTGADGTARVTLDLPEMENTGRPLQAELVIEMAEGSGRPVERTLTHPVAPAGPMIGIRPKFDSVVPEGSEAGFDLIALAPDLSPQPMTVRWTVNRINTRYQWYEQYGNWNWEPITTRNRVATGEATLGQDSLSLTAPVDWGHYEIVVERTDGDYVAASTDFHAGWYAPADTTDTPDTLELSLDKSGYHSGETAQLRVVPRFAGTALISVMSNRLIDLKAVDVSEGENLIPLEVTDDWGTGVYVTATVIRPMDVAAGQNPSRALGLSYAKIDPGEKQLSVAIDAPEKMTPNGPLDVEIAVDGVAEGETAHVTLAAVDVGILNLTGFESPDPSAHYFGQRRLGVEIRDIYGRLIDGMNGEMGALRSGGDAGARDRLQSPPPTEDLVAYFEGPVTVGPGGRATVTFDLPDFNGTLRLMAIAWTPTAVGQTERDVLVRNPVVVSASLPRFLAPGDESRLLLEITHTEGPSGRMGLDLTANGVALAEGAVPSGVTLGDQATARLSVPITAGEVGDHTVRLALTTPAGKQIVKTLSLPVRANDPEISTTRRVSLDTGQTFTLDGNLFEGLRPGTGSAVISAGALARFDAPGLLQSLDRYAYGCTEQIASRALPLLYFEEVARALDLHKSGEVRTRVDEAITQILTRQASNGAFGLWRAESGDFWLDAYVSDVLSRAKAQGHDVPQLAFAQAMDNLRNRINYAPDFDTGGEDIAYALMVLAREGAAAMGDLRYYADVKAEAFTTPLGAAQLGAALAYYGDQTRADRMFARADTLLSGQAADAEASLWRADYGTDLRDAAAVLTLAVESGSDAVNRDALAARIAGAAGTRSTQESAWSLLATHAVMDAPGRSGLSVDGVPTDAPLIRVDAEQAEAALILIRNDGPRATDLTVTTLGVPDSPAEKGGYGMSLSRSYYTMEGAPLDSSTVKTGDRFVTVLRVVPHEDIGARLIIDDPLPAGFEIDNPNLLRAGDIRELDWLSPAEAEHSEFRTDRFVAAVNWRSDDPLELAYIVRAVSPGSYHHPAASVEDMYRPRYRARTGAGRLTVTK
ncbi:hypothetical protein SAMN04490248_10745 [Salinihabitans flavidus]|uniref:Apple domain-containing protein n=1 Tax=Salinihabitans flavidus TaxID=569882 RepID=A0A1H8QTL5_9RHOB|nr:alpha-2-macroglobulin family protein [Salinihabitans flavidus]SEO57629.1 hypothetical protein SAMN04490248_10745 [Salinihabitans flavidus]